MSGRDQDFPEVGRRGLLIGGGALAGLAAAAVGRTAEAAAPVTGAAALASMGVAVAPFSSPVATTIGSPPLSFYVYRTVGMYEFQPFNPAAARTWGGAGVYSGNVGTAMRAVVDIPPGALVADVEYYIYNSSANTASCESYLYVPGQGSIFSIGAQVSVPAGSATIAAYRAAALQKGPYPLGARLYVSVTTPSDGTVQINGARVGLQLGGGQLALQPKQVRVYDSKAVDGSLKAGETRSVPLPSSYLPPGTTAVILDVTTSSGPVAGNLKVFGSATPPAQPNVYFGASVVSAAEITVPISPNRNVKILTSRATHVALDIVGTVS